MNLTLDRVILTPEHVQLRLRAAGLGARFLALLVDAVLALGAAVFVKILLGMALPQSVASILGMVTTFVLMWGYHVYFEVWGRGQTPGKRALGLRVVDGRGLPITLPQSFIRNIVRVLDFAPVGYGVGALACLVDPRYRRLGDLAADTLVIREAGQLGYRAHLPPSRRFNSLRTPRTLGLIRHRIGLELREYLLALCLRAEGLEARARFDLMEAAGQHLRERLDLDDPHLSGENLVRDVTSILYDKAT